MILDFISTVSISDSGTAASSNTPTEAVFLFVNRAGLLVVGIVDDDDDDDDAAKVGTSREKTGALINRESSESESECDSRSSCDTEGARAYVYWFEVEGLFLGSDSISLGKEARGVQA